MSCPSCGTPAETEARFCSSCGTELARRTDERRVATVLFGDLVGFTAISERLDPETVKRLIDRCFARLAGDITAFGGRVDKVVGDGIVALFGAPVAHENDAERAVRAALRMQETIREMAADIQRTDGVDIDLWMRIGVNTGEVLVGAIKADGEYTAMGDVVNTASRLQVTAAPGTVVVGPATHARTSRIIDYTSHETIAVRGREEPVETWVARAAILPPGYRPVGPSTPLVGRQPELEVLTAAVAAAVHTRRPAFVLIVGDAGMGKTRLAEEVLHLAARDHGATTLAGRCVPYGEANLWWPIAEVLRHAFQLETDALPGVVRERVTAGTRKVLGVEAADSLVAEVAHGLLRQLGIDHDPDRVVEVGVDRDEAVRAAAHLQRAQAANTPLVVRLADLHWADDVVLEYLDELLGRLGRTPVIYLCTARSSIEDRWHPTSGRHNTVVLNLDPLSAEAADELLDHLTDGDVDDRLRSMLVERSGGNPFFLEELVSLLDSDADAVGAPRLPDTLRGLLAARIDSLAGDARAVLQDAAVFGARGYIAGLRAMSKEMRGTPDIDDALGVLVAKDILKLVDERRWEFRNDMMREVAYNTITKADRALRHFGIADYLAGEGGPRALLYEPNRESYEDLMDIVAHHMATSAELTAELGRVALVPDDVATRAVQWLVAVARRATEDEHHRLAVSVSQRALSLAEAGDPRRAELLLCLGEGLIGLMQTARARSALDSAQALAHERGEALLLARVQRAFGALSAREGEYSQAVELFDQAIEGFEAQGEPARAAGALREMGLAHLFMEQYTEAEQEIRKSLDVAVELGDRRGEAWGLQNLAWIAFIRGQPELAEQRIDESAEVFRAIDDQMGLAWAEGLRAFVWSHQGRFTEAAELAAEVQGWAEQRGDRWAVGMTLVLQASVSLWTGETGLAVNQARTALECFGDADELQGGLQAAATLARALVMSGQVEEGYAVFDGSMLGEGASTMFLGLGDAALASAAASLGDVEVARRHLPREVSHLDPRAVGDRDVLLHLALLHLMEGDVAGARSLLGSFDAVGPAGEGPRASSDPFAVLMTAWVKLFERQHHRAVTQAALVLELGATTYIDRAQAYLVLGLAHAGLGDADAAVSAFENARDEAEPTGDVVTKAVVALGAARGAVMLNLGSAEAANNRADRRLASLGIDARGWRQLLAHISLASGASDQVPG